LLQGSHDCVEDKCNQQVERGRRAERFKAVKRKILDLSALRRQSITPMVRASEEFLTIDRNSEVSGGRTTRKACGIKT
jgi:hypothetical protein